MNVERYRSLRAIRALWHGLTAPHLVYKSTLESAIAVFAIAILLLSGLSTGVSLVESQNTELAAEAIAMRGAVGILAAETESISLQHSVTLAIGNALFTWAGGFLLLSALFLFLGRFMADLKLSYRIAVGSVASVALIFVLKEIVTTGLHLAFGTIQYGMHAGVFFEPASNPVFFSWVQRADVFTLWAYISMGAALVGWEGLDKKYGYIIGITAWIVMLSSFGVFTVISSILIKM